MAFKPQDVSPTSGTDELEATAAGEAEVVDTPVGGEEPSGEGAQLDDKEATQPSGVEDAGEPEETKEDLLSVVKKAAGVELGADGKGMPPTPGKQEQGQDKATPDKATGSEDDPSKPPPFHNHPRWKEVIRERDSYKADSAEYRKITSFLDENRLDPVEAANALQAAALVKAAFEGRANPRQALEFVDQWRVQLAQMVGIELPEDLRARVDEGFVDEQTAAELAAARARNAVGARMAEQGRERAAAQDAEQTRASLGSAATDWEAKQRASDPDYSRKQKAVERYARALMADYGAPASPSEVVQLLDMALKEVNQTFAPAPRPKATAPQPRSFSSSTAGARPAPKTFAEAVRFAAEGGGS